MSVRENSARGVDGTDNPGPLSAPQAPLATIGECQLLSNRGISLNLDWVKQVRVNTSAVERRAQTHITRRTVKNGSIRRSTAVGLRLTPAQTSLRRESFHKNENGPVGGSLVLFSS